MCCVVCLTERNIAREIGLSSIPGKFPGKKPGSKETAFAVSLSGEKT